MSGVGKLSLGGLPEVSIIGGVSGVEWNVFFGMTWMPHTATKTLSWYDWNGFKLHEHSSVQTIPWARQAQICNRHIWLIFTVLLSIFTDGTGTTVHGGCHGSRDWSKETSRSRSERQRPILNGT